MGAGGVPGASLRAFRDYLPKATIIGADIDKRILFQDGRIQTYFVDQTDLRSLESLGENIPDFVDLIIDDGFRILPMQTWPSWHLVLRNLKISWLEDVEDIP